MKFYYLGATSTTNFNLGSGKYLIFSADVYIKVSGN